MLQDYALIPASDAALARLAEYRAAERAAYNASDLKLADLFAEDLILISNGVETIRGREAARALFARIWGAYQARIVSAQDETVFECGPILIVSGKFTLELVSRATSEIVLDIGRYVSVLKQAEDQRYLLWREAAVDSGEAE